MGDNPVHIGEVIVHGVLFDPKNTAAWRSMDVEGLYLSVPRLFDLLEERGVSYVLVGGIAMLAYVEGRNTQDIDLIIESADLEKLPEITIRDRNPDFARGRFGELQIDFLLSDSKFFDDVRRNHVTTRRFVERDVPCATVEGLLLTKLFALPSLYRQGQFAKIGIYENDAASLIQRFRPAMDQILDELAKFLLASDLEEVRKIVADIEQRIATQSKRFGNDQK
jgi:hypothetical protein